MAGRFTCPRIDDERRNAEGAPKGAPVHLAPRDRLAHNRRAAGDARRPRGVSTGRSSADSRPNDGLFRERRLVAISRISRIGSEGQDTPRTSVATRFTIERETVWIAAAPSVAKNWPRRVCTEPSTRSRFPLEAFGVDDCSAALASSRLMMIAYKLPKLHACIAMQRGGVRL